jgi:hypothetical protein
MTSRARTRLKLIAAGLVAVLASAACATVPKADRFAFAPAGSTWVVERRDTGSFGFGVSRLSNTTLGPQTWRGRPVIAADSPEGTVLYDRSSGNWVALVKGATALAVFDPPLGYDWPVVTGKSWTRTTRVTTPQGTTELRSTFTVEAHEKLSVRAGTFRVFRIRYADQHSESLQWWDPDTGLWVQTKAQRRSSHPMGTGTRETEMVSIKMAK